MLAIYSVWYLVYQLWLRPAGQLNRFLTLRVAEGSRWLMQVLGYPDAQLRGPQGNILHADGQALVAIGDACNGLDLYALFASFVLAAPGPWRSKLWYVPGGILAIYALNLLRVALLGVNAAISRTTVDFNHHYTFVVVVYGFIFLLWAVWLNRFSGLLKSKTA
ncbi:MAG: exosortase/archaeosortase family protein [Bernardetiaceae bacterium]|jgi:exosortase family protein XrtF|nr:exosortase/archaeosortase family protein [Bernardetiaceae bacterium]